MWQENTEHQKNIEAMTSTELLITSEAKHSLAATWARSIQPNKTDWSTAIHRLKKLYPLDPFGNLT